MTALRRTLLVLLCAGLWLGASRVFAEDEDAPDKVPSRDAYVGADTCKRCHEAAHDLWSGSSHANTVEVASEDNMPAAVLAGETAEHPPGKSTFSKKDGKFFVETLGPDGTPTQYHLSHVVGRMRVRMYIATLPDGRTQVLPGMLEEPTQQWFDYTHLLFGAPENGWDVPPVVKPGEASFWTGPVRAWDAKCARCHVSGRRLLEPQPGQIGSRSEHRRLGIDCESCHGPGAGHVRYHETHEGGDPMPLYHQLARDRAVSVCLQCHMEAEVDDPNFAIGDDIFEFVTPTLLIDPERIDAFGRPLELVYDGLPFSTSRCVAMGEQTCITCHDPHGSAERSQLRTSPDNDEMCTECHEAIKRMGKAHTHHDLAGDGARCVSCHMPFLTIERGHGVVADHSISIPFLDQKSDRMAQDACTWCHTHSLWAPDDGPKLGPEQLRSAYAEWWPEARPHAWQQALAAARAGEKGAGRGLVETARRKSNPRVVRASAARLLERYAKEHPLALLVLTRDDDSLVRRSAVESLAALSGKAVDEALLRALKDPSAGVRAAAARAATTDWTRLGKNRPLLAATIEALEEDVAAAPDQEMRWFRLGAARDVSGDKRGALAAYERYVALDPLAKYVKQRVTQLRQELR